jgi:hypothetical protein
MSNPWKAIHLRHERAFTGAFAIQAVDFEYSGHDDEEAEICGLCNAPKVFYRATVGAYQCHGCYAVLVTRIDQATGAYTERWVA